MKVIHVTTKGQIFTHELNQYGDAAEKKIKELLYCKAYGHISEELDLLDNVKVRLLTNGTSFENDGGIVVLAKCDYITLEEDGKVIGRKTFGNTAYHGALNCCAQVLTGYPVWGDIIIAGRRKDISSEYVVCGIEDRRVIENMNRLAARAVMKWGDEKCRTES